MRLVIRFWMCGTLLCGAGVLGTGRVAGDEVAAIGTNILLKSDLKDDTQWSRKRFLVQWGRDPSAVELEQLVHRSRGVQLAEWVLRVSMERTARELGVSVSADDKRHVLDTIYKDPEKTVNEIAKSRDALLRALREARAGAADERQVYERHLKELMPYESWQAQLAYYDTDEKVQRLEEACLPTREKLYEPVGLDKILLEQKLREKITESVSITDDQVRQEYSRRNLREPFEKVAQVLRKQLLEHEKERTWQEWRMKSLRDPTLRISDKFLRSAYDEYVTELDSGIERRTSLKRNGVKP